MGSNLVIVAIPDENDRVWKISSEKVPHLTVLFLGEEGNVANLDQIMLFVEHAANTSLKRFYLPVDRRGELGADQADVLFFKKGRYDFKAVRDFRSLLLKDPNIKTAYDSTKQFETPEAVGDPGQPWIPHLTLGYPATPAKKIPDDDFGFYSVDFHKIAVWTGDFEGPEFLLKDYGEEFDEMDIPMDVTMSDLQHYGVKGMKWGQRKTPAQEGGRREGIQKFLDPQGHRLSDDLFKSIVWPLVPPLGVFAIPSDIRLVRGAGRTIKSKAVDTQEKRFEKKAQSAKNFAKIHNGSIERSNRELGKINDKYKNVDLTKNPKKQKQYDDEVLKMMQDSYRGSANSITNRANTRHLDVEFKGDGMDVKITAKEGPGTPLPERVRHAADDEEVFTFHAKIKRDATGHIVGFEFEDFEPPSMAQSTSDVGAAFVLEHYGVKGMRWGQRKPPPQAVGPSARSVVPRGTRRKTKIKVAGGENHPAHDDAVKVAQAKAKMQKSGTAALSNKELQDLQNRLNLERNVKQLVTSTTTTGRGRKFVRNLTGFNKEVNEAVGAGLQSERLARQVRR